LKGTRRLTVAPAAAVVTGDAVLLDTGVLVALLDRLDTHHDAASAWMARASMPLLTVAPVLSEAAFFLPARLRVALASLAARGIFQVHAPDAAGYARIAQLFGKYADQDPDWADLELVWLAEATGIHRIATLDVADFNVYRINGRKRFELELLR
jgi:predicted nucleic acid-binding protein